MALPLFHAITGCDTISHFLGCGKKTAGHLGKIHQDSLNTAGTDQCTVMLQLGSLHMQKLERFVVITYIKGCGLAKVNEARHRLFTSGKKTGEHPTITSSSL